MSADTQEPVVKVEEEKASQKQTGKHEHILGTFLLILIVFFILTSLVGLGWVGYSQWNYAKEEGAKPTIQTLDQTNTSDPAPAQTASEPTPAPTQETPAQQTKTASTEVSLADIDMAVMNGGGATGAAGKLADTLKQAGITKIEVGSTEGDFTGEAVYYAPDKQATAEKVLELVKKEYPQATLKPQDSKNSETKTKDITVILGK